jgi:NAD(P)-dependent dehydrogenase (short-subunit alcohol dehydrogenase family)
MNPQTKRVAIVIAAGRGMGKAIATELGRRGYQLVLLSPGEACWKRHANWMPAPYKAR